MLVFISELMKGGRTYAVPEPVGGGGETDTTGTDWEREDLANDDPGGRTPGHGETGDEEADEGDHGGDGGVVALVGLARGVTNAADDDLHDNHAHGTVDEDGAATEALDNVEGDRGGADVDEGSDELDEEGVADRAELLEEDGTEIEDEVDTSQLLHSLESNTEKSAAQVGGAVGDGATEAVGPASHVARLWDNLELVLVVGNDLSKLILDVLGVNWLATDGGESLGGLVELAWGRELASLL